LNNKLSKSTFIRGLQCEKSLYLYKRHYNLKDPVSPLLQAVFDQGTNVGVLAQLLFPNGVDASPERYFNMIESVDKTKSFISDGEKIIYEATFVYNDVLAALDILIKDEDGWKAFEVKSSTKVAEAYIKDAALQYYTIVNSGIYLKDISIIYINNQYLKNGELDVNELFSIESVKDQVLDFLPSIPNEISRLKRVIDSETIPAIDIGPHCTKPYNCDYMGTCWKDVPEYSVFNISRLKIEEKFNLYNNGVVTLDQINLRETRLNPSQVLQVQSEVNDTSHIDKIEIENFVSNLSYPVYFLDFETINPAVPIYDGSRPYQAMVFQYSLHIQDANGSGVTHREYLASTNEDPRPGFAKQMIEDCGSQGDILVYNISFERGKLQDLIEALPQYSDSLCNIIYRLKDLMMPFQKKWHYTPEMKGSYSIKNVLPALAPEFSYNDLDIKEGATASNAFLSMVNGTFKGDEGLTRKHLIEYCKMDTFAMVKILEVLIGKAHK